MQRLRPCSWFDARELALRSVFAFRDKCPEDLQIDHRRRTISTGKFPNGIAVSPDDGTLAVAD
jgi:hypothetical protein